MTQLISLLLGLTLATPLFARDSIVLGNNHPAFEHNFLAQNVVLNGKRSQMGNDSRKFSAMLRSKSVDGFYYTCSSVIGGERFLLTNAHCLIDKAASREAGRRVLYTEVEIYLGLSKDHPQVIKQTSSAFYTHESYPWETYLHEGEEISSSQNARSNLKFDREAVLEEFLYFQDFHDNRATGLNQSSKFFTQGSIEQAQYDIGLVVLEKSVNANLPQGVEPFESIAFIPSSMELPYLQEMYFAGYGLSDFDEFEKSDRFLSSAQYKLVGDTYIDGIIPSIVVFPLVTNPGAKGHRGADAYSWLCGGDSGAGGFIYINGQPALVGLHSKYNNRCLAHSLVTLVGPLSSWIYNTLMENGLPAPNWIEI